MTLYIGYYTVAAAQVQRFADAEDNGTTAEAQAAFQARVVASRQGSFAGNIVASYSAITTAWENPNIMIVETDDVATLSAIGAHYNSVLEFTWTPANSIGTSTDQVEAAMDRQFGRN
jgi:hypothetical protein